MFSDMDGEGAKDKHPMDLFFVNRDGLVGALMVRVHLRQRDHEMIVTSWRSKEGCQQNCHLVLLEGRLFLGGQLSECLGRQS